MIKREITQKIKDDFFKGKVIILVGARQVGKTTLVKTLLDDNTIEFNGDNPTDRSKLSNRDFEQMDKLIGDKKLIFIDEAQKIENIGNTLKLLVDNYKSTKQIIATGSSSLNLLSNTEEPLTGRKFTYELFGLSIREISDEISNLGTEKILNNLLIYGTYPDVFLANEPTKQRLLLEISNSYLFKDILELEQIKNPASLNKLLASIALQIGSDVSINELSNSVNLDLKTVERYIDLLEKNFVIFRLPPYYSNQRKTLSKLNKIFFCDLGIRNALINNFNGLSLRNDIGGLWENFLVLERLKMRKYNFINANQFFWRTYDGAEIDLVEQYGGKLYGYEFKWGKENTSPKSWLENPNSEYKTINKDNYLDFLTKN
ncbi:MAG: ATP-binding protein [bacterium]